MRHIILAAVLVLAPSAQAAKYSIDKDHSSVSFKIRHLVSMVRGGFNDFSGTLEFDEATPSKAGVSAVIQTASIDTRNSKRDDHLRSADFFDAVKFPTITFKSGRVTPAGKGRYMVGGTFSMHGVEKPVTLTMEYSGKVKDPWGNTRAGFSGKTVINRKDFGIVYNKTLETGGLMLGEEVEVQLDMECIESK